MYFIPIKAIGIHRNCVCEKDEVRTLKRRRKKVRKPFFTKKKITIFTISLIVIVAISAFMLSMSSMFTGYDDVDEVVEVEKETGKVNFLLVGIDKEASLTDTIMVASYDLDQNKVNILSIPTKRKLTFPVSFSTSTTSSTSS